MVNFKKSIPIMGILYNNNYMRNKGYKSYITFTTVFFIFIALFIFFSIGIEYKKGQEKGYTYFNNLKGVITTAYLSADEFSSGPFKQRINIIFSNSSALQSIIIADNIGQIEYLKARSSFIFAARPIFSNNIILKPEYDFNKMLYNTFSDSVIIPGNNSFNLEIVYQIINYKNILNILKFTILLMLLFIVSTFFFLIFFPCKEVDSKKTIVSATKTENNRHTTQFVPLKSNHQQPIAAVFLESNQQPIAARNSKIHPKETVKPQNSPIQDENNAILATEFFYPKLTYELDKATSEDSDLTLTMIKYETDAIEKTHALYEEMTSQIQNFFINNIVLNLGNDTIAIILSDLTLEGSITKISAFITSLKHATGIKDIFGGASSRNGRIVSPSRIIMETENALAKALAESNSPVIAFKPNPEKFRQMISESTSG